jgi:hypothetical protein
MRAPVRDFWTTFAGMVFNVEREVWARVVASYRVARAPMAVGFDWPDLQV